ncbi:MAG: hypothetical protein P8182_15055 [Deltaproteobacteria bacterium]
MKTVREIAVPVENAPGTLSAISELLGANGIPILAVTLRAERNSGSVHVVVPEPDRVANILEGAGYAPSVQEIIAAEIPLHPGGLNALLKSLRLAGVNIEYLYSFIGGNAAGDSSILLLGVNDLAEAVNALSEEWIQLHGEELFMF